MKISSFFLALLGSAVRVRSEDDDYASGAWRKSLDGPESCWTGELVDNYEVIYEAHYFWRG